LQDKVISSRNIIVKEGLFYKDDNNNIINNDIILLDESSSDYNIITPYINNIDNNNQTDNNSNNNNNNDQNNNNIDKNNITGQNNGQDELNDELYNDNENRLNRFNRSNIQPLTLNPPNNNDFDELSLNDRRYNTRSSPDKSSPSKTSKTSKKGLNIYKTASIAYFTDSLIKGEINNIDNDNTIDNINNIDIDNLYSLNIKEDKNDKIIVFKKDISDINLIKKLESYKEAINSIFKDYWLKSMQKELNTLKANNTWQIVPYKDNIIKPLKTRWVYKIKDYNDYIEFKSRFVAKGFEQILGLNYIDSFASVIKQMA
jgi:hypothetical protein